MSDPSIMNLTNLNTRDGIGANALLAEIGPFRILVDAGLDPKCVGRAALPDYKLVDDALDFAVLTHCHLDHLGSLPVIMRRHPQAPILCSIPTANIAPRMLINSFNVMKRQREEISIPEYPLYTQSEIFAMEKQLMPMPFGKSRIYEKDGQELTVTLYPSGHIPGAASVLFEHKHRRILFTGDVLFRDMNIIQGARLPGGDLDTLVMETTRGDTRRPTGNTPSEETERMLTTIATTLDHGGSVLMPVFALGRMQEILFILNEARRSGKIPDCPVITSGLGIALADHFDALTRKTGLVNFRKKILQDLKAKPLQRKLDPGVDLEPKGIYILSSGMLVENTPSYLAASCLLGHAHNALCFVGYCDPDTPGGKLLATAQDESFIFETLDYVTRVRARIERYDMSGHADREELLDMAINYQPRAIVLTHGDPDARAWFEDELYSNPTTSGSKILNPQPGEHCSV